MPRYNLGWLLYQLKRPQEAIEHFTKALDLDSSSVSAHTNLGLALVAARRPSEAAEHYQIALRLRPKYIPALLNLADANALLNQPEQAISAANQALALSRQAGNAALVDRIEAWLTEYRDARSLSLP